MPATLKLQGGTTADLDLSTYLNAVEGEGLDPAPGGILDPQFASSSVGDGQGLVNINVRNSESVWPLHLKAASKDALHTLVQTLRRKLSEPGVRVEWRDDGATLSTFRDLEFGRWEPGYRYHRARHFMLSGSLRCWAEPYGHTATERIVGTAAGSGPMLTVSVPSVAGDTGARLVCAITGVATLGGELNVWGVSVVPSGVLTEWRAASISADITATLIGASGVVGSQYRGIYFGASTSAPSTEFHIPQASLVGDQRLLMLARTPNLAGCYMRAIVNGANQPTAYLSSTYPLYPIAVPWTGWQLVDLGVLRLPPSAVRPATTTVVMTGRLASYAGSLAASPGMHVGAFYVVPEARTSIVVDTTGPSLPGRMTFDAVNDAVYDHVTYGPRDAYRRGAFPTLSPASAERVLAFAFGAATNGDASAVVRVRERFTFQR